MSQLEAFRTAVESFLDRAKITPTQFGRDAVGDPSFVPDLRGGRAPSLATVDKVLAFIRSREPLTSSKRTRADA